MAKSVTALQQFVRTEKQYELFISYVRAGADPNSAAMAVGIPLRRFQHWQSLGYQGKDKDAEQLFHDTCTALGEACVSAEVVVKDRDPKWWLINGPKLWLGADTYNKLLNETKNNETRADQSTNTNNKDFMQALIELRSAGIDLNNMVDVRIKQLGGEVVEAKEYKQLEEPVTKLMDELLDSKS